MMVVFWGGCTTTEVAMEDPFFEKWQTAKEDSRAMVAAGNLALMDQMSLGNEELFELTEKINAEVDQRLPTNIVTNLNLTEKTSVAVVLRMLAEAGEQNILIGEGVTQMVEVSFSNIPWDQAFKSLLSSAGLSYEWEGQILHVLSLADLQGRLELDRVKQESQAIQAAARQVAPMHVKMIPIRFGNAVRLAEIINQLVVDSGVPGVRHGKVTVDQDSNTLIVHAIKSEIDKVSVLVAKLDRPKPQVLIESKIVETTHNTARELGIQWGGGAQVINGNRVDTFNATRLEGYGVNTPAPLTDSLGLMLGYTTARLGGGDVLELQLTALQEDGKINILSSPSITTLDNETALIEAGQERAYRATTGLGNNLDFSVEWKTATLKLEVTPHVIDPMLLKLDVLVHKDSFDESRPTLSGEFPVNTKKARTTLLLRNGETTVIGGLSQEATSESASGVPFLKDIPLIGGLFRTRGTGSQFDEIMIFITPEVLLEKARIATSVLAKEEEGESGETSQ
jgi:type IV pilus assembly protein PilQ